MRHPSAEYCNVKWIRNKERYEYYNIRYPLDSTNPNETDTLVTKLFHAMLYKVCYAYVSTGTLSNAVGFIPKEKAEFDIIEDVFS